MKHVLLLFAVLAIVALAQAQVVSEGKLDPPAVSLANVWRGDSDPKGYWVSEKLDGVRGYWDGRQLLTRGGAIIKVPAWFIAGWPDHPLDGELWAGRGKFSEAVSTVRSQMPDDAAWRRMHYMLFDLPGNPGPFDARVAALKVVVESIHQPWVAMVPQTPATTAADIRHRLRQVVAAGGEGLVLHKGDAPYRSGRSDDLLKVKPYLDAEAKVIALVPGKGKYAGLMGALQVETESGQRFKLGTGFSDQDRYNPPLVGAWVTYRYRDLTSSGLPKFASYLRVRSDREAP
jgi:DNA ligase-1